MTFMSHKKWFEKLSVELEWNTPFTFRGRNAILLSLAKADARHHLVIAYERNRATEALRRSNRDMRSEFEMYHKRMQYYYPEHIHIPGTNVAQHGGQITTLYEGYISHPNILANILERVERCGAFTMSSPHSVFIACYNLVGDIDYDRLMKCGKLNASFDFPETIAESFIEQPFVLPLEPKEEVRIPYTEPSTRKQSEAIITGVTTFNLSCNDDIHKLEKYLIATEKERRNLGVDIAHEKETLLSIAPPEHKLVVVEFTCDPANSVTFYTDHHLYGEVDPQEPYTSNAKLSDINGTCFNPSPACSGKGTCCIGFVPITESSVATRLFQCFYWLPRETVDIEAELDVCFNERDRLFN